MKTEHSHKSFPIWPSRTDRRRTGDVESRGETSLRFALLCGTYLAGADFRGADLTGASLRDAVIDHDTDFRGARLCGADLRARGLPNAMFDSETVYDDETRFPHGFDPRAHELTRHCKAKSASL